MIVVLKTGLTPSASGSAYLELEPSSIALLGARSLAKPSSALKLSCTVHGPRPLPRSAPFTSQLLLSTHVKFAPFASRQRRGYVRDNSERDLAVHLETALKGMIISERWPKSGLDVVITVLEGEEDNYVGQASSKTAEEKGRSEGWGAMSILAGCITVASAAVADAGVDCVDLVTGGVAALVRQPAIDSAGQQGRPKGAEVEVESATSMVKDPCPVEHEEIAAACVVGYSQSRDEITEIWMKGNVSKLQQRNSNGADLDTLMDQAVEAAMASRLVLLEAVKDSTELKIKRAKLSQT